MAAPAGVPTGAAGPGVGAATTAVGGAAGGEGLGLAVGGVPAAAAGAPAVACDAAGAGVTTITSGAGWQRRGTCACSFSLLIMTGRYWRPGSSRRQAIPDAWQPHSFHIGQLHREPIDNDFVKIATHEETHGSFGKN